MACDWTGAGQRVRRKQEICETEKKRMAEASEKKKNEKLNFYDSLRV